MMNSPSIFAVIVTYGNRENLLYKTIDSVLRQTIKLKEVLIVNNGSKLDGISQMYSFAPVKVLTLDKNYGSAKAYGIGIYEAVNSGADLIWLLDDDNVADSDSLKVLYDFNREKLLFSEIAVSSTRVSRLKYRNLFSTGINELKIKKRNSFFELTLKRNKKKDYEGSNFCEVEYVTYGGLLFAAAVISKVGFPDENYFTYMDDRDFTYRFHKSNIQLFVLKNSIIVDIDESWGNRIYFRLPAYYHPDARRFKTFYSFRNRIRFDLKYSVTNKLFYKTSIFIYIFWGFIASLLNAIGIKKSYFRFKLLYTIIKHEFRG